MTSDNKDDAFDPATAVAEDAAVAAQEGQSADAADRTAALIEELERTKQDVLYAHAETQNVRRRLEKELADARSYASTSFARDMLSVADNLSRALAAMSPALREDDKMKGLVIGLEATGKELEAVLSRNGVVRFVSVGEPLDPNKHQAMIEIPSADAAPGTVLQEMQPGYMIKDRLLRPALVAVAKAAEAAQPAEESPSQEV